MIWTPQQDGALVAARAWLRSNEGRQVFRIFGWAGTGKSTLAVELGNEVEKVVYAAFTGKAALVMRKKGCKGATTLHHLIYRLESEKAGQPTFTINKESDLAGADLLIVDEVSMVDEVLAKDILSFGVRVLVLGDPFQLPPIKGLGYFTEDIVPDIMLTEIHRQAADNPIIHMSMDVRDGIPLKLGAYGDSLIINRAAVTASDVLGSDQVIVGKNQTRIKYNDRIRELKGLPRHDPVIGDRLICLRNNRQKGLMNGQLWRVVEVMKQTRRSERMKFHAEPEDAGRRKASTLIETHRSFFENRTEEMTWEEKRKYDEFTFGYAITAHKSQGSQWDNVYLFDESYVFRDSQDKWLYTALTRAAERITIVK